ncbi:MAG: hypothetical protein LBK58_03790 [Prevotellaceae bacterium]|jgi:hypothetical protein|nr:hypothetical protein [Prevotellaceae bacterium]
MALPARIRSPYGGLFDTPNREHNAVPVAVRLLYSWQYSCCTRSSTAVVPVAVQSLYPKQYSGLRGKAGAVSSRAAGIVPLKGNETVPRANGRFIAGARHGLVICNL